MDYAHFSTCFKSKTHDSDTGNTVENALGFFKPVTTSVLPQSTESTMSFKIDVFLTVGWGGGEVLSFCKLLIYS